MLFSKIIWKKTKSAIYLLCLKYEATEGFSEEEPEAYSDK